MHRKSRDGPLKSPNRVLHGPSQQTLSVVGKFVGNLKSDRISAKQEIYVVNGLQRPLLGSAGMVVVPKPDGRIRICVDLTKLNQSVHREHHILPSVEQSLAQLKGETIFSKLEANSGFWQIELTKESSLLTTFITPFGRYCFNRLPFGITSTLEYFQTKILQGIDRIVCLIDDILVYGKAQEEHCYVVVNKQNK